MTWRYELTYASYALTVKTARGLEESAEWLEGGQESRAFPVNHAGGPRTLPPALAKSLEYLPFALIVVVALFPFSRRPVTAS
jgi:hypothetical protein